MICVFFGGLALGNFQRGLVGLLAKLVVVVLEVGHIEAHAAFSLFGPDASLLEGPPVQDHLQARGILEGRLVGLRGIGRGNPVRDEVVEAERPVVDQVAGGDQVVAGPFRRDAEAGFAHEGGWKGEGQRLGVEPGQHDLPALGETADERIEQAGHTRGVVDRAVITAFVIVGMDDLVAFCTGLPVGVDFPHRGGGSARGDGKTRQKAAENAVAHDQVGQRRVDTGDGMARRRGQREERARLAHGRIDAHGTIGGRDEAARRPAEQALDVAVAIGAGHEDDVAGTKARGAAGLDDLSGRLVAGHERIAHAGKRRHLAGPEEFFFGAGGDAGILDVDHHFIRPRIGEVQLTQTDGLRSL